MYTPASVLKLNVSFYIEYCAVTTGITVDGKCDSVLGRTAQSKIIYLILEIKKIKL